MESIFVGVWSAFIKSWKLLKSREVRFFLKVSIGSHFQKDQFNVILELKFCLIGPKNVQMEPNSVWSIPCVCGMYNKKSLCYNLRLANFKNSSFSSGQGIVQINPNLI